MSPAKKDGSQMLRVDVSQQFKALSPARIAVATRRLGKRMKTRWKCSAVKHGRDAPGKPKMTLVKRVYRKKGERVWSFGSRDTDIEKTHAAREGPSTEEERSTHGKQHQP